MEVPTKEVTEVDLAVEEILSGTGNEALTVVDEEDDIGVEYSRPKPSAVKAANRDEFDRLMNY